MVVLLIFPYQVPISETQGIVLIKNLLSGNLK